MPSLLRNLDFENIEAAFGVSAEVTVGLSAEVAGGLTIMGSDGSVSDQSGLQPANGNLGGCLFYACGKASGSYSFEEEKLSSIAYTAGEGEGFDASLGQPANAIIVYGDNNKGWWKIPFFPKLFPIDEFRSPIQ